MSKKSATTSTFDRWYQGARKTRDLSSKLKGYNKAKDGPLSAFLERHGLKLPSPDSAMDAGQPDFAALAAKIRAKTGPKNMTSSEMHYAKEAVATLQPGSDPKAAAREAAYFLLLSNTDLFRDEIAALRAFGGSKDSARDAAARAKVFDKAHWVADSAGGVSYTGMRGNWFLTARLVRSKDGLHWVSYAKHKDSRARRIAGRFKDTELAKAKDAAARLAVDEVPKEARAMDKDDPILLKKEIARLKQRRAAIRGSDPEETRRIDEELESLQQRFDDAFGESYRSARR